MDLDGATEKRSSLKTTQAAGLAQIIYLRPHLSSLCRIFFELQYL